MCDAEKPTPKIWQNQLKLCHFGRNVDFIANFCQSVLKKRGRAWMRPNGRPPFNSKSYVPKLCSRTNSVSNGILNVIPGSVLCVTLDKLFSKSETLPPTNVAIYDPYLSFPVVEYFPPSRKLHALDQPKPLELLRINDQENIRNSQ